MKIALDVMGGDNAPEATVAGAVLAAQSLNVTVFLVGQPDVIETQLAKHKTSGLSLQIVPASEVIEMDDKPAKAVRSKPDSSMVIACQMVRTGEAQAFVTAGNTGGALAAGILKIGRIKGIMRPALITPFPTLHGFCAVLDVSANADTKPEHMQQFAIMGTVYARNVLGAKNPTVRLLSNGEEAGKGNQLVVAAYELLANTSDIRFEGNIESKEVFQGKADIVVSDGFTGNIFLKTAEASGSILQQVIVEELTRDPVSALGGLLAKRGLNRVHARVDDSETGGAVLLGLSGLVVVAHGRSNANAVRHAIRVAKNAIDQDVISQIQRGVAHVSHAHNELLPVQPQATLS